MIVSMTCPILCMKPKCITVIFNVQTPTVSIVQAQLFRRKGDALLKAGDMEKANQAYTDGITMQVCSLNTLEFVS